MFFIWLGCIIFSICALVGEYLLIRIAVRDGIDTSSTADWREMYVLEQDRAKESMPSLDSMLKDAAESSLVKSLPVDQRNAEIERIVSRRARKVVHEARNKRSTLTIVGIVAGAAVSALMVFGGLSAQAHSKKSEYNYTPYPSHSSTYDPTDSTYEDYLDALSRSN
ncbi:hypothetical protein [Bifidobacterium castoris]|uniref:Uncharacterized protein n=1 Tax=Bifidobacterium castoris TaxID=2306972 RepID=A0A430F6A6_9BIFI|nr:hypothetical protein [Bifidobacterium castoris]RSX47819.1 hypothetical protein D2E22_1106 [Bifidobacterium castoris]